MRFPDRIITLSLVSFLLILTARVDASLFKKKKIAETLAPDLTQNGGMAEVDVGAGQVSIFVPLMTVLDTTIVAEAANLNLVEREEGETIYVGLFKRRNFLLPDKLVSTLAVAPEEISSQMQLRFPIKTENGAGLYRLKVFRRRRWFGMRKIVYRSTKFRVLQHGMLAGWLSRYHNKVAGISPYSNGVVIRTNFKKGKQLAHFLKQVQFSLKSLTTGEVLLNFDGSKVNSGRIESQTVALAYPSKAKYIKGQNVFLEIAYKRRLSKPLYRSPAYHIGDNK